MFGHLIGPIALVQYVQGVIGGWLRQIIVNDAIPGLLIQQTGAGVGLRVETGIEVEGSYVGGDLATSTATGADATAHGDNCDATGDYSGVAAGSGNVASSNYSFVGGGQNNEASTNTHATVCGGSGNDATGQYSFVGGGQSNVASAQRAVVGGGLGNVSSGNNTVIGGGLSNTASGHQSVIGGGTSNTTTGDYATIPGGHYGFADKYGQFVHAAGRFSANGDAQFSRLVARSEITHDDANWHDLFLDGVDDLMTIPAGMLWQFEVKLVGVAQGLTERFGYHLADGVIENDGGTTTLRSGTFVVDYETDAAFAAQIVGDNANDCLIVQVMDAGSTGDIIRWVATVDFVQVRWAA